MAAGAFVNLSGLLAFLHLGLDHPLAPRIRDGHRHAIDRSAIAQREGVDRFDLAVVGIVILLINSDAGEGAGDVDVDIGVGQCTWADQLAALIAGFEFAAIGQHDFAMRGHSGRLSERHEQREQRGQQRE